MATVGMLMGLAALLGLGAALLVAAARGTVLLPRPKPKTTTTTPDHGAAGDQIGSTATNLWALIGAGAATTVLFGLTRWIAPSIAVGVVIALTPRRMAAKHAARREDEIVHALATWTEMLRDLVVTGAGVMEAIKVSASLAPEIVQPNIIRLISRLERGSTRQALRSFAKEIDHPQGDMLVVALSTALSSSATGDLGKLLSRIARTLRSEVVVKERVDASRAKIRASAKIVYGVTVTMLLMALLTGTRVIEAFHDVLGQIVLAVAVLLTFLSIVMMNRLARWEQPFRFSLTELDGHERAVLS